MSTTVPGEALAKAAGEALGAAEQRLARYVAHESPTGDAVALNALADVLTTRYAELGATVERVTATTGDHVVARWGNTGRDHRPHLLLLGHHDTVWPSGQLARMPWHVDGDTAHGPGAFDMKGGLVVVEMAIEVLRRCGVPLAHPVRLVVAADEEVGSPTARAVVEEHADGALAVLGFESPHPDGGLKTARLGSTRVRVEVTGRESHAALDPAAGVSAVDELVDQLVALRAIVAGEPGVLCNVGTVHGGGRTNVVPATAWADIGLRFGDADTERRVMRRLRALTVARTGATVRVRVLTSRPAWPAGTNEEFLARVAAAGQVVGQRVTGKPATGAADTNFTGSAGLPTLDGFGPLGAGAHAIHERIHLPALASRAALVASVLSSR